MTTIKFTEWNEEATKESNAYVKRHGRKTTSKLSKERRGAFYIGFITCIFWLSSKGIIELDFENK